MLFFDVTKASGFKHSSGIGRVSERLRKHLAGISGVGMTEVVWNGRVGSFVEKNTKRPFRPQSDDWLLTPELFSEEERPGFSQWLNAPPCRSAALYHDSIPLRFPEFTWPHSVARHPYYLKLLAQFDTVLANSEFSARELKEYWAWLGVGGPEPVPLTLGADGHGMSRLPADPRHAARRSVVMVGIVEPRKNQTAVLDAAERLWGEGVEFSLTFVGRVNPFFGKPIAARMGSLSRAGRPLVHLSKASDADVLGLLAGARFALMPSLAEGCGLPVLESLWAGVPTICSDIPPLKESSAAGGCLLAPVGDTEALERTMRLLLSDNAEVTRMANEAATRPLPTWRDTAETIFQQLS